MRFDSVLILISSFALPICVGVFLTANLLIAKEDKKATEEAIKYYIEQNEISKKETLHAYEHEKYDTGSGSFFHSVYGYKIGFKTINKQGEEKPQYRSITISEAKLEALKSEINIQKKLEK